MLSYYLLIFLSFISNLESEKQADSLLLAGKTEQALQIYTWQLSRGSEKYQPNLSLKASFACLKLRLHESGLLFLNDIKKQQIQTNLMATKLYKNLLVYHLVHVEPNKALIQLAFEKETGNLSDALNNLLYTQAFFQNKNDERFFFYAAMLDTMLTQRNSPVYKNEAITKVSSSILPGTGQWYAGEFKMGAGAFMLNALGGYLTGKALLEERPVDAGLIFALLWYRYYKGNIQAAEKAVSDYNKAVFEQFREKVMINLQPIHEKEQDKLLNSLLQLPEFQTPN